MPQTNEFQKMVPRHPFLLSLEGWRTSLPAIPDKLKGAVLEFLASKSEMKMTRWLLRKGLVTEKEAAELGACKGADFKLSCRFNDILRMGDSPHYSSCLGRRWGGRGKLHYQVGHYLVNRDICVLYVPDKHGDFQWRLQANLVVDPDGKMGLMMHRAYGNADIVGILLKLQQTVPIFIPSYIKDTVKDTEWGKLLAAKNSETPITLLGASRYIHTDRDYSDIAVEYVYDPEDEKKEAEEIAKRRARGSFLLSALPKKHIRLRFKGIPL